jgi:putative hydrolase of the HAD superfamily
MKYEAVIFDLFGTLVDSFTFQDHQRMLSKMTAALTVSSEDFSRRWYETSHMRATGLFATIEANIEHICQTLGLQPEGNQISAAAQVRIDFTRGILIPQRDAIETLARLKAAGYKIGLISDCSPDVPLFWQDMPFASLVDVPIFSCAVGFKKPDPRIYRLACKQLAVVPQKCLYVGDGSSRELTGALQVGMHPVLINVPTEENSHESLRPDPEEGWQGPIISALKEVLTLVDSELGNGG